MHAVGAHADGWHERVTDVAWLAAGSVDVDFDRVERPAVAGLVLRWRERALDDPDSPNGLGAAW